MNRTGLRISINNIKMDSTSCIKNKVIEVGTIINTIELFYKCTSYEILQKIMSK